MFRPRSSATCHAKVNSIVVSTRTDAAQAGSLAILHAKQMQQVRVTAERSRSGELQKPTIEIARPGLTGSVTLDGYLP